MNIVDISKKRYTAKHYDKTKTIPDAQMEKLYEVLRNSPSSVNSQPWHFIVVASKEGKEKILPAMSDFNHPRITDSSHTVIFCVRHPFDEKYLQTLLEQEDKDGRYPSAELKAAQDKGRHFFVNLNSETPEALLTWESKQLYIALGNLLFAAAAIGIDSTPIEGFDDKKMDEILGLKAQGLKSVVIATLGYHATNDDNAQRPKSRLSKEQLFTLL